MYIYLYFVKNVDNRLGISSDPETDVCCQLSLKTFSHLRLTCTTCATCLLTPVPLPLPLPVSSYLSSPASAATTCFPYSNNETQFVLLFRNLFVGLSHLLSLLFFFSLCLSVYICTDAYMYMYIFLSIPCSLFCLPFIS